MARIMNKGYAIAPSETLTKDVRAALALNNFDTLTEEQKMTLTGGLIQCAIQSFHEIGIPNSHILNRLINANPWTITTNNGYCEIIFNRMIQQEVTDQFTNEAHAEFAQRETEFDVARIPPARRLDPYVHCLKSEAYKNNYNEFRTKEDVINFMQTFVNAVMAGYTNDMIQAHSDCMEKILKDKFIAVPGKKYSKNTYMTRRKSPVLYTPNEDGGVGEIGSIADIDKFISQLKRDIEQMRLMTKEYNALGRPTVTDKGKMLLILHHNVFNVLEQYKSGLFNPRESFPSDVEVIQVVESEMGYGATQIIQRDGYKNLVLGDGKTIDFTKINALLIDEGMFVYNGGELEMKSTSSGYGLYTNYYTHALNVRVTILPKGFLPAVLYTNTATVTDPITIDAPIVEYNKDYPGHFSHRNDFVPST